MPLGTPNPDIHGDMESPYAAEYEECYRKMQRIHPFEPAGRSGTFWVYKDLAEEDSAATPQSVLAKENREKLQQNENTEASMALQQARLHEQAATIQQLRSDLNKARAQARTHMAQEEAGQTISRMRVDIGERCQDWATLERVGQGAGQ